MDEEPIAREVHIEPVEIEDFRRRIPVYMRIFNSEPHLIFRGIENANKPAQLFDGEMPLSGLLADPLEPIEGILFYHTRREEATEHTGKPATICVDRDRFRSGPERLTLKRPHVFAPELRERVVFAEDSAEHIQSVTIPPERL